MIRIFVIILLAFYFSCSVPSKNVEKEEGTISSILIDEMAIPFPPPPPPPKDGSVTKPINRDSINKVKVEIVVDTMMFSISPTLELEDKYSNYQNLVDSISYLPAKPIKTKYVSSRVGHTLIFGNSLDDSDSQYSQMIRISRIVFNEDKTKAVVFAGHTVHPLSGKMNFYIMKKANGKWEIITKKRIETS